MKPSENKSALILALISISALVFLFCVPAFSFNREVVDGTNIGLYWPSMPVRMSINNTCSTGTDAGSVDAQDCIEVVGNSFITWSEPSCTTLSFTAPSITFSRDVNSTTNLVVWRFGNEWKYSSSILAMTIVSYNVGNGEILNSYIEVNGRNYNWEILDAPSPWDKNIADIQNTITHEAGHVIGLDHSNFPQAVMYAYASPGEIKKRVLSQDDINGVCDIYNPDAGRPGSGGCSCSIFDVR